MYYVSHHQLPFDGDPKLSSSKDSALTMTKGPVIIITGTPGTGKTTHAQLIVNESPIPLKNINVSEWVKERGLFEEYDQEWQSYTVDEDRVRFQLVSLHAFNPYEKSLAIR